MSRYDRDDWVDVQYNNLQDEWLRTQFGKSSPEASTNLGVAYDYGSVMHYSACKRWFSDLFSTSCHCIEGKRRCSGPRPAGSARLKRLRQAYIRRKESTCTHLALWHVSTLLPVGTYQRQFSFLSLVFCNLPGRRSGPRLEGPLHSIIQGEIRGLVFFRVGLRLVLRTCLL